MVESDAASRFQNLKFTTRPRLGCWQTPERDGFRPQAADAIDSLAAGLLQWGLPLEYVRKKLYLKLKSQLRDKEAEILAAKEFMKVIERFAEVVAQRDSPALKWERMPVWSKWENLLGVPLTPELAKFCLDQQTQFIERLDQDRCRLESTLQACEERASGALFGPVKED